MRTRLWVVVRLVALIVFLLSVSKGLSQQPLPDLAQIKAAAEAGDAQAQARLGDSYEGRMNEQPQESKPRTKAFPRP
jgi:hypothetical protein